MFKKVFLLVVFLFIYFWFSISLSYNLSDIDNSIVDKFVNKIEKISYTKENPQIYINDVIDLLYRFWDIYNKSKQRISTILYSIADILDENKDLWVYSNNINKWKNETELLKKYNIDWINNSFLLKMELDGINLYYWNDFVFSIKYSYDTQNNGSFCYYCPSVFGDVVVNTDDNIWKNASHNIKHNCIVENMKKRVRIQKTEKNNIVSVSKLECYEWWNQYYYDVYKKNLIWPIEYWYDKLFFVNSWVFIVKSNNFWRFWKLYKFNNDVVDFMWHIFYKVKDIKKIWNNKIWINYTLHDKDYSWFCYTEVNLGNKQQISNWRWKWCNFNEITQWWGNKFNWKLLKEYDDVNWKKFFLVKEDKMNLYYWTLHDFELVVSFIYWYDWKYNAYEYYCPNVFWNVDVLTPSDLRKNASRINKDRCIDEYFKNLSINKINSDSFLRKVELSGFYEVSSYVYDVLNSRIFWPWWKVSKAFYIWGKFFVLYNEKDWNMGTLYNLSWDIYYIFESDWTIKIKDIDKWWSDHELFVNFSYNGQNCLRLIDVDNISDDRMNTCK